MGDTVVFTLEDGMAPSDLFQFPIAVLMLDETGDLTIAATVEEIDVDSDLSDNESSGVVGILPRTGLETDRIAPAGLLMLLLGAFLIFLGRRRREDEAAD